MKKHLTRMLLIVSILIFGYQNFCYADVVMDPTIHEFLPFIIPGLIGVIGIIILFISAISYFSLKVTVKKQYIPIVNVENTNTINSVTVEKKKNIVQMGLYISGMILAIICLVFLFFYIEKIDLVMLILPIVLFVFSIIFRLLKNKYVSNRLFIISICLVGSIVLWVVVSLILSNNYNEKFLNYEIYNSEPVNRDYYISDVEGFINTVKSNNTFGRKVSIEVNGNFYTTTEELDELLRKINKPMKYKVTDTYTKYNHYLKSVKLSMYLNSYYYSFVSDYEGTMQRGYKARFFIDALVAILKTNDLAFFVSYTPKDGETLTKRYDTNNLDELTQLKKDINSGHYYNIEYDETYNVLITYVK